MLNLPIITIITYHLYFTANVQTSPPYPYRKDILGFWSGVEMSVGRRNCSEAADGFVSEELLSLRNMLSVLPFLPLLSSTPEEEVSPQKLSRFGNISALNEDLVNFSLFLTRQSCASYLCGGCRGGRGRRLRRVRRPHPHRHPRAEPLPRRRPEVGFTAVNSTVLCKLSNLKVFTDRVDLFTENRRSLSSEDTLEPHSRSDQ